MRICIIGGGLTGLSAAYCLGPDHDITLIERSSLPGGCLSSYQIGGYSIERYYHHLFSSDLELLALIEKLGLRDDLVWLHGSTGYYAEGRIYPLTTPSEILKFPLLSVSEKARLAWLTLRARSMDAEKLDGVTAEDFIIRRLGDNTYRSFFEPLLRSKFGGQRHEVSAAWLIGRISIRSDRGMSGERLGYLKGGFQRLVDALVREIGKNGCRLTTRTPATALGRENGKWSVNGTGYDLVISTIPPGELERIGGPVLPKIPYQGAACLTLGLDRDVTEGIYWLNMKDEAPYGAVVSHTNFAPKDWYNEHIVYLASYFSERVAQRVDLAMITDFCRRFDVPMGAIHWHFMAADRYAGPVYTTGYRDLIPAYRQNGLIMAGMFSRPNYPERSMNGAVVAGSEAAATAIGSTSP